MHGSKPLLSLMPRFPLLSWSASSIEIENSPWHEGEVGVWVLSAIMPPAAGAEQSCAFLAHLLKASVPGI